MALLVVVGLAGLYLAGVRRVSGPWPASRTVIFAVGLAILLFVTCGVPAVYADSLFWMWTVQSLVCWLVVPVVLLFGHPVQLARQVLPQPTERVLASRPLRVVSNPYVSTALVPVLSFVIFFGPVPRLAIAVPVAGWLLQVVLVLVGAGMALWLVGLDDDRVSTLAAGMALAVGMFELVIDAVPGIVMRLNDNLVTSYFQARTSQPWAPSAIGDQRTAGSIIWFVAELIDLPFVVLAYRRWRRVDAKDAAVVDAVLEAERTARNAETDEPWWLNDPAMQQRLKRRQ